MVTDYEFFLQTGISLAPLGVIQSREEVAYFCTPKDASIIGWGGVDGVHFCFVPGCGDMVFAVGPMNSAPHYVHPLAESFVDFLRLLLACGDVFALEQAWMWNKSQFTDFLQGVSFTAEVRKTLDEISSAMNLSAMEHPWEYIKSLQASFDSDKIVYSQDYYKSLPTREEVPKTSPWKVYFNGNFWGHRGRDHAGKEIPIGKEFQWLGHSWLVPAVYSCSKGLVVDLCMSVAPDAIRAYMEKWNLNPGSDSNVRLTREQRMEMERENPTSLDFILSLEVNGRKLQAFHGCSMGHNPCLPKGMVDDLEEKKVLGHYGLDPACGWTIYRQAFLWDGKRRHEIRRLSITMEPQPVWIPGTRFTVRNSGDTIPFIHPIWKTEHVLTVEKLEQQSESELSPNSDLWDYPTHCQILEYTITPEIPGNAVQITDCSESDSPRAKESLSDETIGGAAFCVGVFVGATGDSQTACSALHFEPVNEVEWRMLFSGKQGSDFTCELI